MLAPTFWKHKRSGDAFVMHLESVLSREAWKTALPWQRKRDVTVTDVDEENEIDEDKSQRTYVMFTASI